MNNKLIPAANFFCLFSEITNCPWFLKPETQSLKKIFLLYKNKQTKTTDECFYIKKLP